MSDEPPEIVRTTRDDAKLRSALIDFLAAELADASGLEVSEVSSPSGSGMSSETLLFDAQWEEGGVAKGGSFVARMAPAASDIPTFPSYDLAMQAGVMQLAARHGVPVPTVRWLEPTGGALGAPFFVMERITGRVPADMPPYLVDGWLKQASPSERRQLQDGTIAAIAKLHRIDVASEDVAFLEFSEPGATALDRHIANQRAYYAWIRDGVTHPLIERAFEHLEANKPKPKSTVVSWGDSRIGNVMYEGFDPVAVLDWEMAGIGPRELDLGWLIFMHGFFQNLITPMGIEGLPDLLRTEDVVASYEGLTGYTVNDIRWYETYAALRHAIIMTRIAARQHHFGGERAEDPDDRFPHRATLEAMLAGTFWDAS